MNNEYTDDLCRDEVIFPRALTAAVAVVGGTEDGDDIAVVGPVVALHYKLMGAGHQGQAIAVVKAFGNVLHDETCVII